MLVLVRHSARQDKAPSSAVAWADQEATPHDPPISDPQLPLEALDQLTERLGSLNDPLLVSSPFRRCVQTAAVLAGPLGQSRVLVDDRVGEDQAGVAADVACQVGVEPPVYLSDLALEAMLPAGCRLERLELSTEELERAGGSGGGRLPPGQSGQSIMAGLAHWRRVAGEEGRAVVLVTHYGVVSRAGAEFGATVPRQYCAWLAICAETGKLLGQAAPAQQQPESEQAERLISVTGCSAAVAEAALVAAGGDMDAAAGLILSGFEPPSTEQEPPCPEPSCVELRVPGVSGFERGAFIGRRLEQQIRGLYQLKREQVLAVATEELWEQVAEAGMALAEQWTPTAYQEMAGMASVLGWEPVSRLAVYYEMEKVDGRGCTSFGVVEPERVVCGQNNDECSLLYAPGGRVADVLLRLEGEPSVLTYTHSGMVAKMGCNSLGLSLMSLAIHDPERNLLGGVPFSCLCRELLAQTCLPDAVELLRAAPRAFPNVFVLAQPGHGMVTCEVTPTRFEIERQTGGWSCHGNNILLLNRPEGELPSPKGLGRYPEGSKERALAHELELLLEEGELSERAGMELLANSKSFGWDWTLSQVLFAADCSGMARCYVRFFEHPDWLHLGFD